MNLWDKKILNGMYLAAIHKYDADFSGANAVPAWRNTTHGNDDDAISVIPE
jgi:hypothetical protein